MVTSEAIIIILVKSERSVYGDFKLACCFVKVLLPGFSVACAGDYTFRIISNCVSGKFDSRYLNITGSELL